MTDWLPGNIVEKIEFTNSCWLWKACLSTNGYGKVGYNGKSLYAHRVVYEMLVGQIPDRLHIDHLCRVKNCVNPSHLEPVTCKENLNRGIGNGPNITHCPAGHAYTDENTYVHDGKRHCKECRRMRKRKQ